MELLTPELGLIFWTILIGAGIAGIILLLFKKLRNRE